MTSLTLADAAQDLRVELADADEEYELACQAVSARWAKSRRTAMLRFGAAQARERDREESRIEKRKVAAGLDDDQLARTLRTVRASLSQSNRDRTDAEQRVMYAIFQDVLEAEMLRRGIQVPS